MQQHPKKPSLDAFIASAVIALGVIASPALGALPAHLAEECMQIEKKMMALDEKMFNELSGKGGSRQPGAGPSYTALKKEREKLKEKYDAVCRQ
jgi:hypothetical protein